MNFGGGLPATFAPIGPAFTLPQLVQFAFIVAIAGL